MSESFQYMHDANQQTVYRFPLRPQVMPQPQGKTKKKKIYHYVRMDISIARADNVLTGNRWKYPTSDYPSFTYDDRYSADEAERYFMLHNAPRGEAISKEEYEILTAQYTKKLTEENKMSSIIDDTNLPAQIPGILAKRPEDRSQIEQAAIDAYNVKLGPAGATKVGEVAGLEAKMPIKDKRRICAKTGGNEDCKKGSLGRRCAICNPSGKM